MHYLLLVMYAYVCIWCMCNMCPHDCMYLCKLRDHIQLCYKLNPDESVGVNAIGKVSILEISLIRIKLEVVSHGYADAGRYIHRQCMANTP